MSLILFAKKKYFRKQRSLGFVNLNKSFCTDTEIDLWNFLSLWEKQRSPRIQQRMFYGELFYSLSLPPSRDQTSEKKLKYDEETWVFIFMAGLLTYLLSCLSPICAFDDAPNQCNGAKWSANGFSLRISEL